MRLRSDRFYADPGERFQQEYTGVRLADGTINLVESDVTDLQEYINSFEESCSIEHIMAMCQAGDTSALNKAQGSYIDCTQMPKTLRGVLDLVIDGQMKFNQLPIEIKEKFGNDFNRWFEEAGSEDWMKKMDIVKEVASVEKEVKPDAES